MRVCLSCVYWTLLLVSVVSSGLLFLIVASEGTRIPEKPKVIGQRDNIPLEDVGKDSGGGYSHPSDNKGSDARVRPTVKTQREHLYTPDSDGAPLDEETVDRDSKGENNLDVLGQSLTPQPNLSQGISETGQAVVLTLVDTATAELQSLAEPRLSSEIRSRGPSKNTTLRTTTGAIPETTATTTTASSTESTSLRVARSTEQPGESDSSHRPEVPLAAELSKNLTRIVPIENDEAGNEAIGQEAARVKDEIPIVRAEQKNVIEDAVPEKTDEIPEDEASEDVAREERARPSPELDDAAARAKLVGGSSEESGAVILDGLVGSGPTDHQHEDIPSFSEWAQKRLEEAEKKKTHPNVSVQNPGGPGRGLGGMKVRSKNYASPDCGAKIVAVNPEARSARSVLVSTRDEYMLNTCTSRVWFVVELCEAIQAKKIELANFELFSSSPKDFSVHVSDRFPTRDWSPVGQFTAKDQRDVQSFALNPHLFGKFIKVELHSHYGSEHFCPISLFRAYGTSEFEVLETETDHRESANDENNEDDEDELLDSESGPETRNLFGSARDAVLRIVKKAAEVLVKTGDPSNNNNITKIQENIEDSIVGNSFASCTTPRYTINCVNCTDSRFAGVFKLLNCRSKHLDDILRIAFVNETLRSGELCAFYGLDTIDRPTPERDEASLLGRSSKSKLLRRRYRRVSFLAAIYSPEYVLALCNVMATKERKLVLNTSYEFSGNPSLNASTRIDADPIQPESPEANGRPRVATTACPPESDAANARKDASINGETKFVKLQASGLPEQEPTSLDKAETRTTTSTESLASRIRPTKALSREDPRKESSVPILEPSKDPNEEALRAEVSTTASPFLNVATAATTTRITVEPAAIKSPPDTIARLGSTDGASSADTATRDSQETVGANENSHESAAPVRPDSHDQEGKPSKLENGDHEAKLMAQDQTSLDSIFSDLKELEADPANIHGSSVHGGNVVAQPTASTTPQQKESVFLRLSNRIKALERNMSLSGQYLEELSKRYKKQVEEMQRSLERATSAMSEESRKAEERELRRLEEISALKDEITGLSESIEILLYDRDSWRSKLSTVCQHFALVVVEILVFVFVVSYCRRNSEFEDIEESGRAPDNEVTRRRSAGATSSCGATKKSKKRRPSEIASKIGGTYRDLMMDDRSIQETKKEKKKRRRKESNGRTVNNSDARKDDASVEDDALGGTTLPSRRSSSTDPISLHAAQLELCHRRKRPDSAPEYTGAWIYRSAAETFVDEKEESIVETGPITSETRAGPIEETSEAGPIADPRSENNAGSSLFRVGGRGTILKAAKLSSPSFIKTALNSRSKRNSKLTENNSEWHSGNSGNASDGGSPSSLRIDAADFVGNGQEVGATKIPRRGNNEDESESGGSTGTQSAKKDKKAGGGLRKMVRKFF